MKLLKSFILVPACVFALSQARAATYISYNFESGTSTAGWTMTGTGGVLSVVSDPLRASNNVLKWDATAATTSRLLTASSSNLTTGKYELSLEFYVGETGGTGSSYSLSRIITMLNYTDYHMLTYNLLAFNPASPESSDTSIRGFNGNGSGGGSLQALQNISETNWYKLTQSIDLDADTWSWSLYDVTNSSAVYSSPSMGLVWNTSMKELHFVPSANETGLLYVDNVYLQSIPEPSAVVLLLVGVAALFIRQGVKKRAVSVLG